MKLTKLEKSWIIYDVGNSAFILFLATIIPLLFKNTAHQNGVDPSVSTKYWAFILAISTLFIAITGPILGVIADKKGIKKTLFIFFVLIGIIACFSLSFANSWIMVALIIIVAKIGFSESIIFYDSMLSDITDDSRVNQISSYGYAVGYIGSSIPFVLSLIFISNAEKFGLTKVKAMSLTFIFVALWWFIFTIPLIKNYKSKKVTNIQSFSLSEVFSQLKKSLIEIKNNKKLLSFFIAFFIYIDGVYTIIEMATSYGKDVGISEGTLLFALLFTQIIAFPCAIFIAKISKKIKNTTIIKISILAYLAISLFALQLDKEWEFWIIAACVGIFQGGIQALSRSYFSQIIPKEKSNEYFAILDIFGKGASFTGVFLVGLITHISGSSTTAVGCLSILFLLGFIVFEIHLKIPDNKIEN